MELNDLRILIEVSRCGSMSQAATVLHMGQPAVSQRIRSLENEVGRPLLIRQHRGVMLTEAGKELLSHAERVLAVVEDGLSAARNVDSQTLHIRLAAPPSVNTYFLVPLIERLATLGHKITLLDGHSQDVVQHVYDGTIDAGFVLNSPSFPGTTLNDLWHDPLVCVMSPQHRLVDTARQGHADVTDLSGERLIWFNFSRHASAFREEMVRSFGTLYQ